MVFHKSPTIRFTTYTRWRYSSTFLWSAQSRRGVRQWLVTEGSCQSADSPLLQLSIRRIKSCRRALTRITAATVVNSLIVTRLDYCNSLLAGCTKQTLGKLQRVLNCYCESYNRWQQSPSCNSATPRSSALAAGTGMHLVQTLHTGVQGTSRPCTMLSERDVHSCRLEQSTTGHWFGTYIIDVQKHAQETSVLSFLLHWITVSRVRAANIVRRPCSDSSHVTAPYNLSFYYYYYFFFKPSVSMFPREVWKN